MHLSGGLRLSVVLVTCATAIGQYFEENRGQTQSKVKFLVRGKDHTVWLTSREMVLALNGNGGRTVVRTRVVGALLPASFEGLNPLGGRSNYFRGADAARWVTNIPLYEKVRYSAVYPGIDVVFHGNRNRIEYDFVIAPGADPHRIRLKIDGAQSLQIDAAGNLVLRVSGGELLQLAPAVYQGQQQIAGRYRLHGNEVTFDVGPYDRTRPLIIDPILSYSTYLGGSGDDLVNAIAVDANGNSYVAGSTASADFPNPGALQPRRAGGTDVFVAKLSASGSSLIYATYFGGMSVNPNLCITSDTRNQAAYGIAVDSSGAAYITGDTSAVDFPRTNSNFGTGSGCGDYGFITKLSPAGSALSYSTTIGTDNTTLPKAIAVDGTGSAYITGSTSSSGIPRTPNTFQGPGGTVFVIKFNPQGTAMVYSARFGGAHSVICTPGQSGNGIAVDSAGRAYVVGTTPESNFPTLNALQNTNRATDPSCPVNAFVTKLGISGVGVFSTYLGGAVHTEGNAIALDAQGNAYITGSDSGGFPLQNPIQANVAQDPRDCMNEEDFYSPGGQLIRREFHPCIRSDAFVAKIDSTGLGLLYSTYLGGNKDEAGLGIAVDPAGNVYVTGSTASLNFPLSLPLFPRTMKAPSLYKSTDSALTWNSLTLGQDAGAILALAVSPADPSIVYAGSESGHVFKTTDRGASWTSNNTGLPRSPVLSLAVDPASASTIYAGTGDGVFASVDGGATWSPRNNGLADFYVTALALAPGTSNVLWATTGFSFEQYTGSGGVYKSTDAGHTWTEVLSSTTTAFRCLAIQQDQPLNVFVGTADGHVLLSNDGGSTFAPVQPNALVVDIYALAIDHSTLYAGVGSSSIVKLGFCKTTIGTGTWSCNGIVPGGWAGAGSLAVDPSAPGTLYAGTPVGIYKSTNWGDSFVAATTGFPAPSFDVTPSLAVDPTTPSTVYAGNVTYAAGGAFAAALNASGDTLLYSTYLGGHSGDSGRGIAVDANGAAYIGGAASSIAFPVTPNAIQGSNAGGSDGFVLKLAPGMTTVTLTTTPLGMIVIADGAPYISPQSMQWSPGSEHMLSVPSSQTSTTGVRYRYDSWSDGSSQTHTVIAGATTVYTAVLSPQPKLTVASNHVGNFSQGQSGAAYTVTVSNTALAGVTSGQVSVSIALSSGLTLVAMSSAGWSCSSNTCTRADALNPGAGYPPITVTVNVAPSASSPQVNTVTVTGGGSDSATATDSTIITPITGITIQTIPTGLQFSIDGGSLQTAPKTLNLAQGSHTITVAALEPGTIGMQFVFDSWSDGGGASHAITVTSSSATYTANFKTQYRLTMSVWPDRAGTVSPSEDAFYDAGSVVPIVARAYEGYVFAWWSGNVSNAGSASTTVAVNFPTEVTANFQATQAGLRFQPVSPCRVVDTRSTGGRILANTSRDIAIPLSGCGIPSAALAYSLNATVVPPGPLTYLTLWPAGSPRPLVSTLNSFDGRVVANAAIVPAGTAGSVSVYVSDATDVILDINGYFVPSTGLAFYPVAPCRVADTRANSMPAGLGPPSMGASSTRLFPMPPSFCGISAAAQAFSLNVTAVPLTGRLGYLTAWPAESAQPLVSTLNSYDGGVVANAAIVPAGIAGGINIFVTDAADVILDINGYFAPPSQPGALLFYQATPCRVADTRPDQGLSANSTRDFSPPASNCAIPAASQAYAMNMTVVPPGPLTYLTAWPAGSPQPLVSTLNSYNAKVVANAAIVPAGQNGSMSVFVTNPTHLILDINGYFAP